MLSSCDDTLRWIQVSRFVADRLGLQFPVERQAELKRGVAGAATELGFRDATACADWLLHSAASLQVLQTLASHLTIGETYFFREPQVLEALAKDVLPPLIRARRASSRRLRLWSAGCCSGEEAYSLAMILRQMLPDIKDWHVSILGTDITPRFLRRAEAAVYGEWSFRGTPPGIKRQYFTHISDGRYVLHPEIRAMVNFAPLNLADSCYPSLTTETNAMDVIFCRNVLMYFTPEVVGRVVANFERALLAGGWLAVSHVEASMPALARFTTSACAGALLRREPPSAVTTDAASAKAAPVAAALPPARDPMRTGRSIATGASGDARRIADPTPLPDARVEAFASSARDLANLGQLEDALRCCAKWVAADKLDPNAHYTHALVLLERGELDAARASLQRAVFLQPTFVLAEFALGNTARQIGLLSAARRHFINTEQLLCTLARDDALPAGDGMTVGRLREVVSAQLALEWAA